MKKTQSSDSPVLLYESVDPEAVEAVAQALADLEAGDQGISLEDYVAQTKARRAQRDAAVAAA